VDRADAPQADAPARAGVRRRRAAALTLTRRR
jgi:hypothetical protein